MARLHEADESKVKPMTEPKKESTAKSSRWLSPFEEMSHLFENFSARNWMRPLHMEWPDWHHISKPFAGKLPHIDVIARDEEIVLRAELPGVDKKDVEVSITDHTMTIKAATNYEKKEEKGDYYRSEIAHGTFSRTVLLPASVDVDNVRSSFKNGLLEVIVPKLARQSRKITIN